jgi:hypothetical protein
MSVLLLDAFFENLNLVDNLNLPAFFHCRSAKLSLTHPRTQGLFGKVPATEVVPDCVWLFTTSATFTTMVCVCMFCHAPFQAILGRAYVPMNTCLRLSRSAIYHTPRLICNVKYIYKDLHYMLHIVYFNKNCETQMKWLSKRPQHGGSELTLRSDFEYCCVKLQSNFSRSCEASFSNAWYPAFFHFTGMSQTFMWSISLLSSARLLQTKVLRRVRLTSQLSTTKLKNSISRVRTAIHCLPMFIDWNLVLLRLLSSYAFFICVYTFFICVYTHVKV